MPEHTPQHTPQSLLRDAVRAIALLGGSDGITLYELLIQTSDDADSRAFLWHELRKHQELTAALPGRTAAQVAGLSIVDASQVRLIASEKLRAHLCGLRDVPDKNGFASFPSADAEKVVEEAARHGFASVGVLQNVLTRAVGIPANKLAYTLSTLEHGYVLDRQNVWVSGSSNAGRDGSFPSRAEAGQSRWTANSARPTRQGGAIMRTNLLTLPALFAAVGAPLSHYQGHEAEDARSKLAQMIDLLQRAPHGLLPLYKLRFALGLHGKGQPYHAWCLLKNHAVSLGLMEEVSICRSDRTSTQPQWRRHGKVPRVGVRLLQRSSSMQPVPLLDRTPLQLISAMVVGSAASGSLISKAAPQLQLHPRYAQSIDTCCRRCCRRCCCRCRCRCCCRCRRRCCRCCCRCCRCRCCRCRRRCRCRSAHALLRLFIRSDAGDPCFPSCVRAAS